MLLYDKKRLSLISVAMICLLLAAMVFFDASSIQINAVGEKSDISFLGSTSGRIFICLPTEKTVEAGGRAYFSPALQSINTIIDLPKGNKNFHEILNIGSNIYSSALIVSLLQKKDGKK